MKKALTFLLGAGAGAGLTLIFAPQSGKNTQKLIAKKMHKGVKQATAMGQKGLDQVAAAGQKGMKEVATAGKKVQDHVEELADMLMDEKNRVANAVQAGVKAYEA